MDVKAWAEASNRFDHEFSKNHLDFVLWWAKHPHNDPDPKYAVAPRIAYKCACYYDEFLESKQLGIV